MQAGGHEKSRRNPARTPRIATIIGLALAAIAIGTAYVDDAAAIDPPKEFRNPLRKNAPGRARPVVPAHKQQIAPVPKQLTANPSAGQKAATVTGPLAKNAIVQNGQLEKRALGRTVFGKGAGGQTPIGTGPNGHPSPGKGSARQAAALGKGLNGRTGLGNGANHQTGSAKGSIAQSG